MSTLFEVSLALADRLGVLRYSTATGGSTSTVVDTTRTEGVNEFDGGTIWIITDAGGLGAAPEGEFARISSWTLTTHTFAISAITAVGAGDRYGFTAARYPLDVLVNAINSEIRKYKVVRYDSTSLDVVNAQSEYDLPDGIYSHNLIGVYEATVDDADDNRWTPLNFHVLDSATQPLLVIDSPAGVGNDIMLEYLAFHEPVYDCDDVIDDMIPLERILPAAAANCELIRMRTYSSESKLDVDMLQFYRQEAREAEMRYPIRYPAKRGKINEAGASYLRTARVAPPASP